MDVRLRPKRKARTNRSIDNQAAVLPNVCPGCEGPGYLEYINLVRQTKTQTCRNCDFRWESPID